MSGVSSDPSRSRGPKATHQLASPHNQRLQQEINVAYEKKQTHNYAISHIVHMDTRVILVTGTPAVGKTTLARKLAEQLDAQYVNLTELAKKESLILEEDKVRETVVVDAAKMRRKLRGIIRKAQGDVVVDGHYAAAVTPKSLVTIVFVLRRDPAKLREFMKLRGYNEAKQQENLEAEILDVCLVEALQKQGKEKTCELDVTGKETDEVLGELRAVLDGKKRCFVGCVDWMGLLEREGRLSDYLKP